MPRRLHPDLPHPSPSSGPPKPLDATSLRVILAPSAYYPNIVGIEELTRQLAKALATNGHRVSVLTNHWPAGTANSEMLDGVSVTRLPFPLPASSPVAAANFLARFPS